MARLGSLVQVAERPASLSGQQRSNNQIDHHGKTQMPWQGLPRGYLDAGTSGDDPFVGRTPSELDDRNIRTSGRIFGLQGNDTIYGNLGHDTLMGGSGAVILTAAPPDTELSPILDVYQGNDLLAGGQDADSFVLFDAIASPGAGVVTSGSDITFGFGKGDQLLMRTAPEDPDGDGVISLSSEGLLELPAGPPRNIQDGTVTRVGLSGLDLAGQKLVGDTSFFAYEIA